MESERNSPASISTTHSQFNNQMEAAMLPGSTDEGNTSTTWCANLQELNRADGPYTHTKQSKHTSANSY
ncbi:hypothetical protein EUGRSUZ_G01373 [Eucalyptus grandis]|uniref:Uncharacterized protein n=2 Tax=Eucalyptus grandis TaxID=71139 RepID=A0ACC3K3A6_EUCGR|nr:hypothetical protein EUGRSUZ_G01373 [Eucalyptus grandis]